MFAAAMFPLLFDHMEWADAAVWSAVLESEAARQDDALRSTLVHLHSAQSAFLDVWKGRPFRFYQAADFPGIGDVQALARAYHAEARAWARDVGQEALDALVVLPWLAPYEQQMGRTFAPTTLGETMYQVIAHSNHHRGQVNARLRALGGAPPTVDYIVWLFFGKPAAAWSLARV